jgi:hypothetical protein
MRLSFRPGILAAIVMALCSCNDQGPSLEGDPLLFTTIDRVPWVADGRAGIPYALVQSERVFLVGRRPSEDGSTTETLRIELSTDSLQPGSYPLGMGLADGVAIFEVSQFGETLTYHTTGDDHRGMVTVDAIDAADSVVVGRFRFDAANFGGGSIRYFIGEFRLSYAAIVLPADRELGRRDQARSRQ